MDHYRADSAFRPKKEHHRDQDHENVKRKCRTIWEFGRLRNTSIRASFSKAGKTNRGFQRYSFTSRNADNNGDGKSSRMYRFFRIWNMLRLPRRQHRTKNMKEAQNTVIIVVRAGSEGYREELVKGFGHEQKGH